jgi:hypothetical protein
LLHAHGGPVDLASAKEIAKRFHTRKRFVVRESDKPHHSATIPRT